MSYKSGRAGYAHRNVAEKALGKKLPKGAIVHHVDEDKKNNTPTNLVICPSQAYHFLLHSRMEALEACGHADWKKCHMCGLYSAPDCEDLRIIGRKVYHKTCDTLRKQRSK